jgi:crotonobetainyl-CoA:carnitine CoA-transferase CaiB-like acyl-CoA transferase
VSSRRDGNRDAVAVPHGCYPCRDGRWIALSCWDDDEWTRLAAAMDDARLAADDSLSSAQGRRAREADLNAALARWTRAHDAADVAARLRRSRVHAAIVNTIRDLFDDPQLLERRTWQPHDHPELGRLRYRMGSYQLSETPGRVRSAAPRLGEHTADVFRAWFGLSAEEYSALEQEGVFS